MTFTGGCLQGRSQHFTFSRRGLLQGLASAALPFLVPRLQPTEPPTEPLFGGLPLPEFTIGDLVASDWENDEDEDEDAPDFFTEFGEVLGVRYLPEPRSDAPADSWLYYINWTHSTCYACSCYPCYDGEPTRGCDLRLVNHV